MGWLFTHGQTRAQLITSCLYGHASPSGHTPVDHAIVRTHLWVVFEKNAGVSEGSVDSDKTGTTGPERFIALYLLGSKRRYGWGYKAIDEGMGLVEVDCPLRLLKLASVPQGPYSTGWRERVRAFHAAKATRRMRMKNLQIGETVALAPGCQPSQVTITSLRPLRGRAQDGCIYRIAPRHLAIANGENAG
jgi:hypothetical protein